MDKLKIKFFALVLLMVVSINISAAIKSKKNPNEENKGKLKHFKNQITITKRSISTLNRQLIKLEKKLGEGNNRYLKVIRNKKKIETSILDLKNKIAKIDTELSGAFNETQKILFGVMVSSLDKNENAADILSKDILKDMLKKKLQQLKVQISLNNSSRQKLQTFEQTYTDYKSVERELLTFFDETESKKKRVAEKYLEEIKNKEYLQSKYDNIKSNIFLKRNKVFLGKSNKENKINFKFLSPINSYIGLDYRDKGITYKFKEVTPVLVSAGGRVIYKGSASTYGNVIMIDHGDETRSVVLGEFVANVKKGATVKNGDILGYTKVDRNGVGKIYFEVRQKNEVQNTILLMDKNFLSNNKII